MEGHQTHWKGAARRAWAEAPVQTQAVDPTEADPWVPSEVAGVAAAVVAAVFVGTVVVLVVVGAETVAVAVAVVAVAVAAVVVVATAAVAVVAALQGSASYVGAYDPGATGHFLVMLGADNPVGHTLTDATIWQEKSMAYLLARRGAIPFSA